MSFTGLRESILYVLHDGAEYGLEIIARVEEVRGKPIWFAQLRVYGTLRSLEREGLLRSYEGEPLAERGWRPRRYYELTTRGAEWQGA